MLAPGVRRGCGPLASIAERSLSTSAAPQAAVPAIAGESSSGFFAKLFGGSKARISTPLSDTLEGVSFPPADPPVSEAPTTQVTKLGNGVRIASEATPGPTASLGIYANVGSVDETNRTTGVTHLLENLAFKATQHRTHFRLVRELEAIGASVAASASREQIVYALDTTKASIPEAVELLADAVLNPKFAPWEVKAAADKLEEDLKALEANPQATLLEGLHTAAFQGGLGRPLIAPPGSVGRLTSDDVAQFVSERFVGQNLVLAAAGIGHEELTQLARPLFDGVSGASPPPRPESRYVGGDFRAASASELTHALLAFEVPGGWRDTKTSVAATVMQFLLGGGGSFSSGGPGKGMHSRLYTRVLNQHGWVTEATAFSAIHDTTGLAGIYLTTESSRIEEGVNIISKELQALTKDVPAGELERAKNGALGSILSSLESRSIVAEDIGRQTLTYGSRKPVAEFLTHMQDLKPKDITDLATRMLKTAPAFAAHGNVAALPRYDELSRRFS